MASRKAKRPAAIQSDFDEALKTDVVTMAMATQGIDALGGTPKEFDAFIRADIEKWTSLLAAAGKR